MEESDMDQELIKNWKNLTENQRKLLKSIGVKPEED